jgi:hypothetical protein
MEFYLMDVHLSVEIKDDLLVAHLLFLNKSTQKMYLDGITLCSENKLEREVFTIVDEDGKRAPYTARMFKRTVTSEEFISLNVGEQLTTTVVLNNAYRLRKGNNYTIWYSAYNPQTLHDDDPLIKMESNKVEIAW